GWCREPVQRLLLPDTRLRRARPVAGRIHDALQHGRHQHRSSGFREAESGDFASGINIDQAAFEKLNQEISLQLTDRQLPTVWDSEQVRLYSGLVPVAAGSFHRIVLREGKIPQIDPRDFSFKAWTSRSYYEVCSNPDVYELIEAATQRAATTAGD